MSPVSVASVPSEPFSKTIVPSVAPVPSQRSLPAVQGEAPDGRLVVNTRSEAERWGWAGATEQLRGYYRQVLSSDLSSAA